MKEFLRQVADHYFSRGGMERRLFILPNRRSAAFLRKYLGEAVRASGRPALAPRITTINDFFFRMTDLKTTEKVTLLLKLYKCYKDLRDDKAESIDDFIYWGDVLLGDFDDIDKYRIDVNGLFANISDLKAIRDDFSYADAEQLAAIEKLASHFTAEKWTKVEGAVDVKAEFLGIWQILGALYRDFRSCLKADGMAYEGMAYRKLAERLSDESAHDLLRKVYPDVDSAVFVGLNALSRCEQDVMKKMEKAGLAEFCWDFSGKMVCAEGNIAGHFMEENARIGKTPFELDPDGLGTPKIHIIKVPSATGQAKLLPGIVESVPENERGLDFAVVLPDETMLLPVLNSLPGDIGEVNVTMGYPMDSSELAAFMESLAALQMRLRLKDGKYYFYHKPVHEIFSSALFRQAVAGAREGDAVKACVERIAKEAKFYVPQEDFGTSELLGTLFKPVVTDLTGTSYEQISALAQWQIEVAMVLGRLLSKENLLQLEFAKKYCNCVTRLKDMVEAEGLPAGLKPQTWFHLVRQMCSCVSVPFDGEPLGGLQVMGPLETRALDFKHIVLMSANEGVFPSRSVSASFIPAELRKAFGLPTYERQDAVWAYYFYRMTSRAENIWMLYDSRAEGLNTGEESRYIKQLRYLYGDCCELVEEVASANIEASTETEAIPKSEEDLAKIRGLRYSASTLQKYIACPAQFYFSAVKELWKEDEINESLDPGMLGNVCHDTLHALFCGEEEMASDRGFDKRSNEEIPHLEVVTAEYLESWLKRPKELKRKIHSLIRIALRSIDVRGRDLVTAEIIQRFVTRVIEADLEELRRRGQKSFRVLGLEKKTPMMLYGREFTGFIDRLDSFEDGTVRVVDYKTGGDKSKVIGPDLKPEDVFGPSSSKAHASKAALQFFLYDQYVLGREEYRGLEVKNAMYSMSDIFTSGVTTYECFPEKMDVIEGGVKFILDEIENPEVGFRRLKYGDRGCDWCDYRMLCGRATKEK